VLLSAGMCLTKMMEMAEDGNDEVIVVWKVAGCYSGSRCHERWLSWPLHWHLDWRVIVWFWCTIALITG